MAPWHPLSYAYDTSFIILHETAIEMELKRL